MLKCTVCGNYIQYEVRAVWYESSGLQVCVDCFGGDLLSSRVQSRRLLSRWFCALLVGSQLSNLLRSYLAPPLQGNLFSSCYCNDVFLSTLQEQHQTVACEGVYRLHEI